MEQEPARRPGSRLMLVSLGRILAFCLFCLVVGSVGLALLASIKGRAGASALPLDRAYDHALGPAGCDHCVASLEFFPLELMLVGFYLVSVAVTLCFLGLAVLASVSAFETRSIRTSWLSTEEKQSPQS